MSLVVKLEIMTTFPLPTVDWRHTACHNVEAITQRLLDPRTTTTTIILFSGVFF